MTEAEIETRITELRKQQEGLVANANAINGAIQDCEFWLERVRAAKSPPVLRAVPDED